MPIRIKAIWSNNPERLATELDNFLKEVNYNPRRDKIQFRQSSGQYYSAPDGCYGKTLKIRTTYTAWIEYTVEEGGGG